MRQCRRLPIFASIIIASTVLLSCKSLGPILRGASAAPQEALAARLGGSRASFDDRYGPPQRRGLDWAYDVPGYGLVLIQFGGDRGDSPALVITLRSPRPEDIPATTPHPSDWTLEQAEQRAQTFLPADARLGDRIRLATDSLVQPCSSDALTQAFGTIGTSDHACQVTYVTPTPDTVSYVTVGLASQATIGPLATPEDPCKGIGAWAKATSQRLQEAEHLLREVSTLAGDTPETINRLRDLAGRFQTLANGQRSSPAPAQMAAANFHLIAGFEAYATGLTSAAGALERHDDAGINEASSALTQAGNSISQASQAMTEGFTACGLTVSTPAPGS